MDTLEAQNFSNNQTSTPLENSSNVLSGARTYAKWYSRLASFIIDSLIINLPFVLIGLLIIPVSSLFGPTSFFLSSFVIIALIAISIIVGIAYYTYYISAKGATPGMSMVGIKTIRESGENLTLSQSFIRYIVFLIIAIFINITPPIGFILTIVWYGFCLVDAKKQNLYDKIFNNIYISISEKKTLSKFIVGGCCSCYAVVVIMIFVSIFATVALINNNSIGFMKTLEENLNSFENPITLETESTTKSKEELYSSCYEENMGYPRSQEYQADIVKFCECYADITIEGNLDTQKVELECQRRIYSDGNPIN